jgi:hypothetical protein
MDTWREDPCTEFFLEWEMSQTKQQRKSKHTSYVQKIFPENHADYVVK